MRCKQGSVHLIDSATKEWEDQALLFETFGHASAAKQVDFNDAMRGTDSAALASVCTEVRLATLTDWINSGRLDLILDAINTATGGLAGAAMRGTDSAALAAVCTEVRLAALTDWINGGRLDAILDIIAADVVNIDGAAMRGTDSASLAELLAAIGLAEVQVRKLAGGTVAMHTAVKPPAEGRS